MATTALTIKTEDVTKNLLFMTVQREDGICDVDIFLCNENHDVMGTPSLGVANKTEEDYHKELRLDASAKGHFVPEHSTNPEWNPGYKEEIPHEEFPEFPTNEHI